MGFIDGEQLRRLAGVDPKTGYYRYLRQLADGEL
jgi:glucose-1-phosphate thymidylyltransferase